MEKLILNRKVLAVFYFALGITYLATYFSASWPVRSGLIGFLTVVGGVHLLVTAIASWRHRGHEDFVLVGGLISAGLATGLPMIVVHDLISADLAAQVPMIVIHSQTLPTIYLVMSALFTWGFLLSSCCPCLKRARW